MKAKYSIIDNNTYNFDKLGFIIGMILTRAVVMGSNCQGQLKAV
jgi:hypothetical protein